jgi:hypothetical protein
VSIIFSFAPPLAEKGSIFAVMIKDPRYIQTNSCVVFPNCKAKAVQSHPPSPSPKHETGSSRNFIEKWYIIWGLDNTSSLNQERSAIGQVSINNIAVIGDPIVKSTGT